MHDAYLKSIEDRYSKEIADEVRDELKRFPERDPVAILGRRLSERTRSPSSSGSKEIGGWPPSPAGFSFNPEKRILP